MANLDKMGSAKLVAQIGAVIGRRFSMPLLVEPSQMGREELEAAIERLCAENVLLRSDEADGQSFKFRHSLVHDVAYESLLKKTRQQLHRRVAKYLDALNPDQTQTSPEVVARHHTQAGNHQTAYGCWLRAGQVLAKRGANLEAISHLHRALAACLT
jgi:predicted ATPase